MARPVGSKNQRVPIEHDIPIPPKTRELYGWRNMEVGDSKFFADRFVWDVNVMVWRAAKHHGFKFTLRKLKGGVRVWRIK